MYNQQAYSFHNKQYSYHYNGNMPNFSSQTNYHTRRNHHDRNSKINPSANRSMNNNVINDCKCEPCEKDFKSVNALNAHLKSHVKCDYSGCTFNGSNKAVKLHFIQTHEKGRFRIVLTTPEEITKWREERKRNWPSKSNVLRKKQKFDDECEKGITVITKDFMYQGKRTKSLMDNNFKRNDGELKKITKSPNEEACMITEKEENNGSGLTLLKQYTDLDTLSDGEIMEENGERGRPSDIGNGGTRKSTKELQSRKEIEKQTKAGELPTDLQKQQERNREKNVQARKVQKNSEICRQVSLLEMLLAKEIRHERNMILQCVRYVINENFLNV